MAKVKSAIPQVFVSNFCGNLIVIIMHSILQIELLVDVRTVGSVTVFKQK